MFIEYRPTVNISQNNLKQGLLGIVYIFHVSVIKKYVSIPDMRQSKTLGEQSMNASQISLQPVFSIANFRQSVFFFYYFWSTFVDNIDVFDCRLSGVNSLYVS